jgi:hypothetical protein
VLLRIRQTWSEDRAFFGTRLASPPDAAIDEVDFVDPLTVELADLEAAGGAPAELQTDLIGGGEPVH